MKLDQLVEHAFLPTIFVFHVFPPCGLNTYQQSGLFLYVVMENTESVLGTVTSIQAPLFPSECPNSEDGDHNPIYTLFLASENYYIIMHLYMEEGKKKGYRQP